MTKAEKRKAEQEKIASKKAMAEESISALSTARDVIQQAVKMIERVEGDMEDTIDNARSVINRLDNLDTRISERLTKLGKK